MSSSLVTMKVPPKNPHFFKPIVPGFKNGIKIPIGFLKYLEGQEVREHAILRRNGKEWRVKLNGRRFEEGWAEFAEVHDLQVGHMLVFRHEGDVEFEVTIFDSSQCNTEYVEHQQEEEEESAKKSDMEVIKLDLRGNALLQLEGKKTNLDSERVSTQANVTEKSKPNIMSSNNGLPNVEAAKDMPHFITTIRRHCISKSTLHVPKAFARENGLNDWKCTIMIRDEERPWEFSLSSSAGRTFIGGDWRSFCAVNFIKEGECVMFEILAKGEKPTLKFNDLRGNASLQPKGKKTNTDTRRVSKQDVRGNGSLQPKGKKTNLDAESVSSQGQRIQTSNMTSPKAQVPASTSANANPHFISTIKPYSFSQDCLYIRLPFAKSNGLFDRHCEMILIDEQLRSWSVRLRPMSHHVGINAGWPKFRDANDLQVGDTYKFELINSDKIPVVYFHCKYAGRDAPGIRKAIDKVMKQLLMGKGKEH